MERKWTEQQKLAIETRDRTLLVSAAAGSGKTATLTERIIRSITDDENPTDISNMLIATFTNAAVDELRERITAAIKSAAEKNPGNARLEEQLLKLKDAKISTITSFCNTILRSCAEDVGLPPNYRIAEPAEAAILFSSVIEGLIEAAYEGGLTDVCTDEEFEALTDCLAGAKTEATLSATIYKLYTDLQATVNGVDTLIPLIEEYNPKNFTRVEDTAIGGYVINQINTALTAYRDAYAGVLRLASDCKLDNRNLPKAQADFDIIEHALAAKDYAELREVLLGASYSGFSKSGGEDDTEFYVKLKLLRSLFKSDVESFTKSFVLYTESEWRALYEKLYKLLSTLYKFTKKLYTVYMEEKRVRGICEFSDVERYAYEALYTKDGEITDLAKDLAERFEAVYVDEYQDVNELQGKVFSAISKCDNRFMVGDIKQSIYGFRSARPEIFAQMKNTFAPLGKENDYPYASLFMSQNFRCDRNIVDFVNGIFDTLFSLTGESIGYVHEDRLEFAKVYPDGVSPTGHVPEIHIIEKNSKNSTPPTEDAVSLINEDAKDFEIQIEHIARKIEDLIANGRLANGERIQPKDICIMLRSVKEKGEKISEILKSHGIASGVEDSGNLFMCEEVLLALSFLYSIDNPRKDIYLVALMCSPLFDFTADEVLKIRKASTAETVWEALLEYISSNPDYERGKSFVSTLLRYRSLAEGQTTDALISLIFRESGLMALASKNGGRENLMLFHSYARKYEKTSFNGLYSFLAYITEVIAGKEKFSTASENAEENTVKIITIHKSKGLEFPVCFIAGASASSTAESKPIHYADGFGIAIKPKDDTGLALVDNPACAAIDFYNKRTESLEELRVLYVALTRAREQLYIYATMRRSGYVEEMETRKEMLSPYFALKTSSLLDMILIARSAGHLFIDPPFITGENTVTDVVEDSEEDVLAATAEKAESDVGAELCDVYTERFNYVYPLSHLETLPEKISVSKLSPTVLDDTNDTSPTLDDVLSDMKLKIYDEDRDADFEEQSEKAPTLPVFITGKSDRESALMGIATHTVLQFCDLAKLDTDGANSEISRLVEKEFISHDDAERVRVEELEAFIKSPLFAEMKNAKKLYRELRFNVKLPAESFTEDSARKELYRGSEVLVQGVIDCVIERSDGTLHLVDYKTDRLTKAELRTPRLADEKMLKRHSLQLSYYSDAIRLIFGRSPDRVGVYSLHAGREIAVPPHSVDKR